MRKSERTAKAEIIAELRHKYPLKELLKLSGIARSTYYYYLKKKDKDKYVCEKQEIRSIYDKHKGRYGYRRVCTELRNQGYVINHKTVQKLMKILGLKGKQRKNDHYHSYNPSQIVSVGTIWLGAINKRKFAGIFA